ncbi:hypothetical protein BU14_0191s0019 [Porphyra umbilicalis]|uniref:Uncharacterized protein n=1 Tax=Porphyra umbilicalis TaxID=2786 RepID=A0A1X6P6T3_PORUM|nr:hypothetical protein BU14_0191s0019 [Porphyra umbilicalis]|eukprot:OSX76440.1 hypothetical protein BU14_0191s0019 [Porphyra umbilicalis]
MGKSLRSKVKKTYRGLRRQVLEPAASSKTLALAAPLYSAAGLPLPDPTTSGLGTGSGGNRAAWTHGGFVPLTSFVPTPPGVRLNRVHGPLAEADVALAAERKETPPRQDFVGEREEPAVVAKDLPLKLPMLFEGAAGGPAGAPPLGTLSMTGVAAAEASAGAAARDAGHDQEPGDVAMAGAGVSPSGVRGNRRRDPRRPRAGGVKKGSKSAKSRHSRNKAAKRHRVK